MREVWKTTPAIAGYYEVSNLGRVRRTAPGKNTFVGKIIKPGTVGSGRAKYLGVCLNTGEGRRRSDTVHRLVCEAFHGPPPENCEVSHKNNKKTDNRPRNLMWCTHAENAKNSSATYSAAVLRRLGQGNMGKFRKTLVTRKRFLPAPLDTRSDVVSDHESRVQVSD